MKHLFLPERYQCLTIWPYAPRTLQNFESFFINYIPLSIDEILLTSSYSQKQWRKNFSSAVADKTPVQIAELAINLCKRYYVFNGDYDSSIFPYIFYNNINNHLLTISNNFSYLFNIEKNKPFKNELIGFLLLSYLYSHCPRIKDFKNNKLLLERLFIDNDKKRYNITAKYKKKPSIFKECFLSYNAKNFDITEQSPYDLLFLSSTLGYLYTDDNPFVMTRDDINKSIDIKKTLDRYRYTISLNTDNTHLNTDLKNFFAVTSSGATIDYFNQYLLERLLLVNFFESYYQLYNKKIYNDVVISCLTQFCLCPLLDLRLRVLRFHEKLIDNHNDIINRHEFIVSWPIKVRTIFTQLIECALPITVLTFHYLMALYYQNKHFSNNISSKSKKEKTVQHIKKNIIADFNSVFSERNNAFFPVFYTMNNEELTPNKVHVELEAGKIKYSNNYSFNDYNNFFNAINNNNSDFYFLHQKLISAKNKMPNVVLSECVNDYFEARKIIKAKR